MQQTTDYSIFKFRPDNREKIHPNHIDKLARSIEKNNLLKLCPILVNKDMEVIDGQHRLLAAKKLNIPIWYRIEETLTQNDLIHLNLSRAWSVDDYVNFYCKQGKEEYIKLKGFKDTSGLSYTCLVSTIKFKPSAEERERFRTGKFVFTNSVAEDILSKYKDIMSFLQTNKPSKDAWIRSKKVQLSILRLIKSDNYSHDKFLSNLRRFIDKVDIRATLAAYFKLFVNIHNWKNPNKIIVENDNDAISED